MTEDVPADGWPWSVLGRSVRGTAHLRHGVRCQDSWHVGRVPGGGLVIAVADGAGSAARSDEGSAVAVRAAVGHVLAALAGAGADGRDTDSDPNREPEPEPEPEQSWRRASPHPPAPAPVWLGDIVDGCGGTW